MMSDGAMQAPNGTPEAIALAHDLGHTPFGHAGEDALDELLREYGGFNHNRQSLRIVDHLEHRYPDHPGLNLTYEVREGIIKHETRVRIVTDEFSPEERPTLEASLVDMADGLTYCAHDVDDGLNSGLIVEADLGTLSIWQGYGDYLDSAVSGKGAQSPHGDDSRYRLVRFLVNTTATDLLQETTVQLERQRVTDLAGLRRSKEPICRYSDNLEPRVAQLKTFLHDRLYRHPKLRALSDQARSVVFTLFERFSAQPSLMPSRFQAMLEHQEKSLVVADYIAGMTDRYAENLVRKLE